MRRLILFRHAKSDWPQGVPDRERPLAPRGRHAAPRIAAYLAEQHLTPDLVLISPARRARETWEIVAPAFAETVPAREDERLYEARAQAVLDVVRETEAGVRTLLVIGHNPGFEDLARVLIGHGDRYAYARMTHKFPTCGIAVIDFPVEDWREVAERAGRLDRFVTPKSLGGEGE
ncbi:histidine phosphatase family protein [Chelatococcus sp. SYSU_G07232]|uniref:Histidine phosphatase family protein n=1 Tax=Chelatococcus albus TaxID=3047466 RepID=A0ABT7AGI9_9HYPH|nr:histidine phosphatase family protein [Chelatococcus sp. SYSU_G07232]MDJ1158473.1 histidine phosphatase family protein [Chelatococcus sp. SYSU_G07232]